MIREDRILFQTGSKNRFETANILIRDLQDKTGIKISAEKIRSRLQEREIWSRKPAKKPLLSLKIKFR